MEWLLNRRRFMARHAEVEEPGYLTFKMLGTGTVTLSIPSAIGTSYVQSVSYSLDKGKTWVTTQNQDSTNITITTPSLTTGKKVMWKGIASGYSVNANGQGRFSVNAPFEVYGHLASMLIGDNYLLNALPADATSYTFCRFIAYASTLRSINGLILPKATVANCFNQLFLNATSLIDASSLIIDVADDIESAAVRVFSGCTSLKYPPVLPALSVGRFAYDRMFMGCTSLTSAPELPATNFTDGYVYTQMFDGCSALEYPPELPAVTLSRCCYGEMFRNCTSLEESPILPATTLFVECYRNMFNGCSNLNKVSMYATNISANNAVNGMLTNTAAIGTFYKNAAATWDNSAVVPSGWTVETVTV